MPLDTHAAPRSSRRFAATRFAVRVGSEWSPIRAATIWPIADVLAEDGSPAVTAGDAAAEARLVLDLIDSGMIDPPRPRHRRERRVSSRAVFYQAADA